MSEREWDGTKLRAIRTARGWSQQRLAWEASTDVGTISRLERGKHGPQAATLTAIASALGVAEGSFFRTIIGTSSSDSHGADGSLTEAQPVGNVKDEAAA